MKKTLPVGVLCLSILIACIIFWKTSLRIPKMNISGNYWSFGTVENTKSIKHAFVIKNLGNADLTLAAWPSCHKCINPVLDVTRIPPNGKTELTVELYIVKEGLNEAYVMMETNDPKNRTEKVTVKAIAARAPEKQRP